MSEIEEIDNEILNEIQWTFPLVPKHLMRLQKNSIFRLMK